MRGAAVRTTGRRAALVGQDRDGCLRRHVSAVMENIDHAYRALGVYNDPDVEALVIDGNEARP